MMFRDGDDFSFQARRNMMKKLCLVVAIVALGNLAASATDINFSLDTFCDTFQLTLTGTPKVYLDGVHTTCPGLPNVLVGGFLHTIPGMGAVLDLSDPTFGYTEMSPYGWEFITNADTRQPCVWASYLYYPGTPNVLYETGTCTYFTDVDARPNVSSLRPAFKDPAVN
jgi:hypothetical protein